MADYHTDSLVIAANEENMKKVLVRIAMNLEANGVFDMADIARLDTVRGIYRKVRSDIDAYYSDAFVGAPIPEDIAAKETPHQGWEFGGWPMSDTADVSLYRYGENWVLCIRYDTAQYPNLRELDMFFMGLPAGDYGVAFYDANAWDGDAPIAMFSGVHHGCTVMHNVEDEYDYDVWCQDEQYDHYWRNALYVGELCQRQRECKDVSKSDIVDLGELADMVALYGWPELIDRDDDPVITGVWGRDADDVRAVMWGRDADEDAYDNDDEKADCLEEEPLRGFDECVDDIVRSFPWFHRLDTDFSVQGNEAIEHLFPGDAVTVVSDWEYSGASGEVTLRVYDADGTCIGAMGGYIDDFHAVSREDELSPSETLACLLPHLKATVYSLVPMSLRNKTAKGPILSVRFDIEPVDIEALVEEVRELLKKPLGYRSLSSKEGR